MGKVTPITEEYQHYLGQVRENFWGVIHDRTRDFLRRLLEEESERARDIHVGAGTYARDGQKRSGYRNGYYEREYVTRFGTIRLRIARARDKSFMPKGLKKFERRTPELSMLVREMFLRGLSTREAGRLITRITGESVSAQTVSNLTRELDGVVEKFHERPITDEWEYVFLDGVSMRIRRPVGRKRLQMLVALGVRSDGRQELLAFMPSQGESQAAWEGFLNNLYRRGLTGEKLKLAVTDGCQGLVSALQVVYPRVAHQRCWVHKMRNILEKVRRKDEQAVKEAAQAIYGAPNRDKAVAAFDTFSACWKNAYPAMVKRLERDLPELLTFFSFRKSLWKKLRTTNCIERRFVEVRRRTRPMLCFVNIGSVERILFSIFNRFNIDQNCRRTRRAFTQAA